MKKYYKIWLHIEEICEDKDHYEDIGEPISTGKEYGTVEEGIRDISHMLLSIESTGGPQ